MQVPTTPAAPQPHQQHGPRRNRLHSRDLLRDFEQDGHEVYNSPQTNLGAALAALGQLEDTPAIQRLQAHIRVVTVKSKKEALDIADQLQALTPGAGQNILANDVVAMVPLSPWLKRDMVKMK
jgi:predicted LPLAT superfamily acyltransferase